MNAATSDPGGLAELQHLVLVAALRASELAPEELEPADLAAAARSLYHPLESVRRSLGAEAERQGGDVVAVARWELGRLLDALVGLGGKALLPGERPLPADLARLGMIRGRILAALEGLDRALVERAGIEPVLGGITLLETRRGLAIRELFLELRQEVRALGDPAPEEIPQALRRIAGRLEAMREGRGLRRLRLADRLQVEALLRRIEASGDHPGEGAGIWRDVAGWAELLLEVNRRAELRAHDGALAARLCRELSARPQVAGQIAFRRQLRQLRGRDDRFDRLLEEGAEAEALLPLLQTIAAPA